MGKFVVRVLGIFFFLYDTLLRLVTPSRPHSPCCPPPPSAWSRCAPLGDDDDDDDDDDYDEYDDDK